MPDSRQGRWLVEDGIGEQRALLVDGDTVLAAKVTWPGDLPVGGIVSGRLVSKAAGAKRGTVQLDNGTEVLVDRIPGDVTEGSMVQLRITRAALAERGRFKRAQGRIAGRIAGKGDPIPAVEADAFKAGEIVRRFPAGMWEEVWDAMATGDMAFAGGSLLFSVTPAMTVVDIDGTLPPRDLALAAVPALARALQLFGLGGSIAIDFPTIDSRADRKAVDNALESALADWPHERTAMNGFGLVHIVARLEGPSLLHRMAVSRVGAAARMALRKAEMVEGPGLTLLTVHPALKAKIRPDWIAELERRTGRALRIETDRGLAIEAAQAQIVVQ
ncbi:MAG: ribonuclease [Citromicrobium sp.]|nr:MAG: ribonuclease [Citromicrobium sp.]